MITKAARIALVNLVRVFRDRMNLFFLFVLPILLVLLVGAAFGAPAVPKLGVLSTGPSALNDRLLDVLRAEPGLQVTQFAAEDELRPAVERGEVAAGLVLPATQPEAGPVELRYLARAGLLGQQVGQLIRGVVERESGRLDAARLTGRELGTGFDQALAAVDHTAAVLPPITVETTTAGQAALPATAGRFDLGAANELLLFVFLNSMIAAVALIESRRLGVSRRMLSTPTSVSTIVVGEGLGRVAVALVQGVFIMAGTALLFGVDWGDPLGAAALLLAFSLVAGAAGLLLGAIFRTEQQAIGIALLLGIGLAALGGAMVPLELFSGTMRDIALWTPHAWAGRGFAVLTRDGGTVLDIGPELGVLAAYTLVLAGAGAVVLRQSLTKG